MKISIGSLNPFKKHDDVLHKTILTLNKEKEVELLNNKALRKEIEALRKEIDENSKKALRKEVEGLRKEVGELRKENDDYKMKNKLLFVAVSPLTELGIPEHSLSEVLKPMFDIYVPHLKTLLEEDRKKRQEAAFRNRGGGSSSAIGVRR
jgi:DNA repair exonuclease SbcCD ATPase subunit